MKKDVVIKIVVQGKEGPCDDGMISEDCRHVHRPNELAKLVNDMADVSFGLSITMEADGIEDYVVLTDGDVFLGNHQSEFSLKSWVKKVFEE